MKFNTRAGRLAAALVCLVGLSPLFARAQDVAREAERGAAPEEKPEAAAVARKIDEFGHAHGCDHGARLDNLALELMNVPDAVGYVIAYGPEGEGNGTGRYRLMVTKNYLVEVRGLDAGRVQTVYGGRYRERDASFVEFWVVPPGAAPPEPVKYRNDAHKFTGKFAEHDSWDSLEPGEALGPPVGDSALAGLADALKLQPHARAYAVAYHAKESAPGEWRRVTAEDVEALEKFGVEAGRIKVIFGGYAEEAKVQWWILPEDAPPPVKEKRERKVKETVKLWRYDQSLLRHEDRAALAFKALADVLKGDDHLKVYFVIRPRSSPPPAEDEEMAADFELPPLVDPAQLVEKWKKELREKYGVGESRLVVMIGPAQDEGSLADLETWLVPPGGAPPDPYAVEEEPEEGEEVTGENPKEF